ncbi:hypothetical protein [Novipirellula artificiosorum]|uniref:Uncharacterized protein n=1 Tax=Novipirellula artificiosorum TaxID=2528016 RepID=A0A5C6DVU6_9BACT|nr:hypothetical protein [Novipirellula artificiosorum]TWU40850.1 hypothetical protein Poly41_16850 [Novipirellula artificiosorum]
MRHQLFPLNVIFIAIVASPFTSGNSAEVEKKESSESIVATELDRHEISIRTLDRSYRESIASLNEAYQADRESLRKAITKKLTKQQKLLTEQGKLDEAVAVRERITQLSSKRILPPLSFGVTSDLSTHGIVGTWRWNNGVDVRNLSDGKTNGNCTWKLVDGSKNEYLFNWSKIPADRVRLSGNGRVLEGTKANDLTFRVWAVRID